MSENARQLAPLVITLKSMKPKQRREMVKAMNRQHFRGLTEVAVDMIKNGEAVNRRNKSVSAVKKTTEIDSIKALPH